VVVTALVLHDAVYQFQTVIKIAVSALKHAGYIDYPTLSQAL
jgi:hypothetical protein